MNITNKLYLNRYSTRILSEDNFSLEQWNDFYQSLDEELKTWSLDLQSYPNVEDFWKKRLSNYFINPNTGEPGSVPMPTFGKNLGIWCSDTDKLIGYFSVFIVSLPPEHKEKPIAMFLHSYVVKKEHHKKGLAKLGLNTYIEEINKSYFRLSPSTKKIKHLARIWDYNLGSMKLAESLGFQRLTQCASNDKGVEYNYVKDYWR